jgi:hypothetical protein
VTEFDGYGSVIGAQIPNIDPVYIHHKDVGTVLLGLQPMPRVEQEKRGGLPLSHQPAIAPPSA